MFVLHLKFSFRVYERNGKLRVFTYGLNMFTIPCYNDTRVVFVEVVTIKDVKLLDSISVNEHCYCLSGSECHKLCYI